MRHRPETAELPSSAGPWLLPPLWPLDGWQVNLSVSTRRMVDVWLLPWIRVATGRALRPRLLAGAALVAAAAVIFLFTRIAPPSPGAPLLIRPVAVAPRVQKPVAYSLTRTVVVAPLPSPVAPLASIAPAMLPAAPAAIVANERKPWTDVSTMDLMMPIAEPDLDISSHTSLWSQIGKSVGVDPLLLYSIALVESKALYPNGKVAPTPWLFRVNNHLVRGDRRDVQLAMAAASQFGSAVQDVGIMQVYYPMHRDAVRDPLTLLNPRTNISVAAKILRAGMRQTPDRVLGVGYYHSHTPSLARDYGTAVMTVYQRLRAMHPRAARMHAVARE